MFVESADGMFVLIDSLMPLVADMPRSELLSLGWHPANIAIETLNNTR
jgi:hypothetical protein